METTEAATTQEYFPEVELFDKIQKYKKYPNKIKKYKNTKVLITQPFFEVHTSDFAWKFIWTVVTVQPNDKIQIN